MRTNAFRNGIELMADSSLFEMQLEEGVRKTVTVRDVADLVDYVKQLEATLAEVMSIIALHTMKDEGVKH